MASDEDTETFLARVRAGHGYARQRWANADQQLVLRDAYELGEALFQQGLDGANAAAAGLEAARPHLVRK
jgi:hypothetical protein